MKQILLLLLAAVVALTASAKNLKEMGLNGSVVAVEEKEYYVIADTREPDLYRAKWGARYEFDAQGNNIKKTDYLGDELSLVTKYAFKNGNLVRSACYDKTDKLVVYQKDQYKDGVLIKSTYMGPDGSVMSESLLTKTEGDTHTYEIKNSGNILRLVTSPRYSEQTSVGAGGSARYQYWFDDNGDATEAKATWGDGTVVFWLKSKFNENRQEIERQDINENGTVITAFLYDDLDEKGNWKRKTTEIDGVPTTVTLRQIEYEIIPEQTPEPEQFNPLFEINKGLGAIPMGSGIE